jgi:hypothetical protein
MHTRSSVRGLASAEQIAIAAAHATDSVSHQATDLRATRRCQPFAARLAVDQRVEQSGGNFTIACAGLPPVQRAKHENQPSPLLCRERRDWRRCRSGQALPEMQCGFDALRQKCVKGNNRCKRCGRRSIIKHPKLAAAAMLTQQDMAAVWPVGCKCRRR